jgi:hypothetical protein
MKLFFDGETRVEVRRPMGNEMIYLTTHSLKTGNVSLCISDSQTPSSRTSGPFQTPNVSGGNRQRLFKILRLESDSTGNHLELACSRLFVVSFN